MSSSFEIHALHYSILVMMYELQKFLFDAGQLNEKKIKPFNAFTAETLLVRDVSNGIKDVTFKIKPAGWPKVSNIQIRLQSRGRIWVTMEGNIYYPSKAKCRVSFSCVSANDITPKKIDMNMKLFK